MVFDFFKEQQNFYERWFEGAKYFEKMMPKVEEMDKLFQVKVPELFEKPEEVLKSCLEACKSFMKPWMEIDDEFVGQVLNGDWDAGIKFFDDASKKYDENLGKIVKIMNMGINLEAADEKQNALDAYYKMIFSAGKVASLMTKCNVESNKVLNESYKEMITKGNDFKTFKDFYQMWYEINEKAAEKLFATDEFSQAFADFSDKYFKYMAAYNAVLERSLSQLPIPTDKDMNSLYLTVYNLRKDMRDLKRKVKTLKEELVKHEGKCYSENAGNGK